MTVALQDLPVQTEFKQPAGIVSGQFDTKSGLLPSSLTPPAFISTEIAAQGDFPTRVSDVWVQKNVDADHPNMLANDKTINPIAKTFLNLPNRDPSWPWPSNEAPYKPPTEVAPATTNLPDSTTQAPPNINTPVDPSLPTPTLGKVVYDPKTYTAVIPMTVLADNERDSTIFYLQRSGQTTVESFAIPASHSKTTSVSISLSENGKPPIPGDYLFWAAFQNRNGSGIGPPSKSVKLTLTD